MLFALNANNSPSMAKIIQVETPAMALSGASMSLADFPIASLFAANAGTIYPVSPGQQSDAGAGFLSNPAIIPFLDNGHNGAL